MRVGSGAGCDASTVQQGITLAQSMSGTDTVQLASGVFSENVTVDGNNSSDLIILQGGFSGCSDTPATTPSIFGVSPVPAVTVINGARLIISNVQVSHPGRVAIRVSSANSDLTLQQATVSQSAVGVLVENGGFLVVDATHPDHQQRELAFGRWYPLQPIRSERESGLRGGPRRR